MRQFFSRLIYRGLTLFTRTAGRSLAQLEVVGLDRIPADGPLILICNHAHIVDPPLVGSFSPRPVHTMAKRELFEVPLMYPEGTRNHGLGLKPALPGAAMVALFTNATVIPVAIDGSHTIRWKTVPFLWMLGRRPHIRIEYGEPMILGRADKDDGATTGSSKGDASAQGAMAATDRVMREVAALLPEDQRGAYGADSAGTIVVARGTPDQHDRFEEERRGSRE